MSCLLSTPPPSTATTWPPFAVFFSHHALTEISIRPPALNRPAAPPPHATDEPANPHPSGLEYETGQLAFLMDATVSASVIWHGHTTYPFTFSIHDYYIKVSDTTDYDRSLCNCAQMMQGARQPPQDHEEGRRRRREASERLQAGGRGRADALAAGEVLLPPTMGDNVQTE